MNNYYPPSPEAASLINKNAGDSLDYYTGRLNYAAPIFSASVAGYQFDIGLRYKTSGFKVQEVAGSVGLGWNLMAGGVITRYVEGLPDEDVNGYCGTNNIGDRTTSAFTDEYFKKITDGDWDSQPDKFFLSFMGMSAVFRLNKDGQPIIQSSENGLKIEYSPFNRVNGRMNSGLEEWIIVDQNGNRYYFGSEHIETTTSKAYKMDGTSTDKTFISSWFIKKIVTAYNKIINFDYLKGSSLSYNYYVNVRKFLKAEGACSADNPESLGSENLNITVGEPIYLSRIYSSDSETDVTFSYNERLDVYNAKLLKDITLKHNNLVKKKMSLVYGYFQSTDGSATKRLKLVGVNDVSLTGEVAQEYQFLYNELDVLPARNSINTDYWGYYNYNNGTSNIEGYGNSNKNPAFSRTASCVLIRSVNKLGGSVSFEYEPNYYNENNANVVGGGIRLKKKFKQVKNATLNTAKVLEEEYLYLDQAEQYSSGQVYIKPKSSELLFYLVTVGSFNGSPVPCVVSLSKKSSEPMISLFDLNEASVGYSRVTVKNQSGYMVYNFTNYSNKSDELEEGTFGNLFQAISSNVRPQFPATSFAFMRGKIKSQEILDINKQTVQSTVYEYAPVQSSIQLVGIKAYPYITAGTSVSYHYGKYYFFNADNNLVSKVTTLFKANVATNKVTDVITYNASHRNLLASKTTSDLSGKAIRETFTYPFESATDPVLISMTQKNQIAEPTKIEKYIDNNLVSQNIWTYQLWHSDPNKIIRPVRALQKIGTSNLETRLNFNKYDSYGNLLELNEQNGHLQSYIWGYGGLYVIAKVVGASYNDALGLINSQFITGTTNYTDQQLRDELDKIRVGLPHAQVFTYTYNPLIGMTSQTSENRLTTFYEYDSFGRLQNIKDNNGSIIKAFQYHTVNMLPNWVDTGLNTDCDKVEDPEYGYQAVNTGYLSYEQKDINPNSATYNQTRRRPDYTTTSPDCSPSYYFIYSTDPNMAQVTIKAKRSFDDGLTKTMRFKIKHDSITSGSQIFEQFVDIIISSQNQGINQEWVFVNAATYLEVELMEIF